MSEPARRTPLWFLPAGIVIGFLGSLAGIGGGLFAVPLLHYARGLELKHAVATALVLVCATTGASTATDALESAPDIVWPLVVPLALGVFLGAQFGFLLAQRIDSRTLKKVFVVVLLLAGLRILFGSSAPPGSNEPELAIGALDYAVSFAVGIGGGFVAPLLGVGGGLVMVPGLYLGIAPLGFSAARACSLAAGCLGATRSLWLHAREGRVDWAAGAWLGAGALLGAFAGVKALHVADLADVGRVLLGVLLVVVSVRFVLDLRRPVPRES